MLNLTRLLASATAAKTLYHQLQTTLGAPITIDTLLDFLRHWDGIITITYDIDAASVPSHLIEPVSTIVTNAVNDAVRHGGAENIGVSLEVGGDKARLCVTNDGADAPSSGPEGLGHASLDRLAGAGWERTRRDGVTELTVHFSAQS
jgi:signal transduction histidine kinase